MADIGMEGILFVGMRVWVLTAVLP